LRFLTAGESHGPSLSVIVEGLPADSILASKRSLTSWLAVVSATDADLECDSSETSYD